MNFEANAPAGPAGLLDDVSWHRALHCRSMLVTPAADPGRFLRGQDSGADISLLDLEDSVPAELKAQARGALLALRREQITAAFGLRVNSTRTETGLRDLLAVLDADVEPDVIVLPKVESAHEIRLVDDVLTTAGRASRLWAIIETGAGVLAAADIAAAGGRLIALTIGVADLCAETGAAMEWDALVHPRSQVALAARAHGLEAVDAPTFDLGRPGVLADEARRSAALGYTGKVAIHPRQIPAINAAYSPTPDQVAWASRVEAGYRDHGARIFTVDGEMIGPPFLKKASSILARSRRSQ
jgi:(S)-citramalyl-CoA lyase